MRDELRALGARRKANRAEDKAITRDIRKTLKRAAKAGVSKTEAAEDIGVHRTTLYRVYG